MVRLLVCDDAAEARALVREMLSTQVGVEIVGEAENGEEAIALGLELQPDVVLMDVEMPRVCGVDATRRIRELLPATRIVAFAGSGASEDVMAMMEAGASAYCVKGGPAWELGRAIVGAGDPVMRLANTLARTAGERVKAELVARELETLMNTECAAVCLLTRDGELIAEGIAGTAAGDAVRLLADVARRGCTERSLVRVGDAFAAPLCADGEPLGAIVVRTSEGEEPDAELLGSVADLAAASLANERRLALSHAEARLDPLTGLANRRAFDERLAALTSDSLASSAETALVMLDIDDFKEVNDTRGHAAGDQVLRRVGLVLRRTVRADEEVFRLGGEEFAIIVEGGSEVGVLVAERAKTALRADRRGQPVPTFSAGVAAMPDATSKDELVRRADAALYAAKWAGKDRVFAYGMGGTESRPLALVRETKPYILIVDDDDGLRALLRATLEPLDLHVEEASDAATAAELIGAFTPDAVVLDVRMPGLDGISFCRGLKSDPETNDIAVVLLTGADGEGPEIAALEAGADAFLHKPFSPLELLTVIERLVGSHELLPIRAKGNRANGDQVHLYAHDLGRLLEIERGQRALLQDAYRETVLALAAALESKDISTRAHSQRVQRYAIELAAAFDPRLLDDPSLEYGFLLHDVGKIGIPDRILLKPGALTPSERGLMQTHTILGEQLLAKVSLLQGEGLRIVRSHHERWDGRGYPDELERDAIPLGARIFAVADTLDAMTSDRPYRTARPWEDAVDEIVRLAGTQFDPSIVEAFRNREAALRRTHYDVVPA